MAESHPLTGTARCRSTGFRPRRGPGSTGAFAAPTQAQAQAWRAIGKGEDTLVIAPTGSGKTLAAFLWAIDRLAAAPVPADPKRRCRVLYVSPLKALAVDIERNLRSPLTGIRQAAQRLGLPEPDIRVGGPHRRYRDGGAAEAREQPPDILITTPESLFLLLTSQARETLRGVETVIVDEIHAVAGTKRGAHLALSLERLDALRGTGGAVPRGDEGGSGGRAQRIGLSATVRPPEEVASFLGGSRPVTVVQPPSAKRIELRSSCRSPTCATWIPQPGRRADGQTRTTRRRPRSIWPHVEERVLDLIQAAPVDDRVRELAAAGGAAVRAAQRAGRRAGRARAGRPRRESAARAPEVMAQAGAATVVPRVARAHHGSVSRQERTEIEEALKAGRLPAVVATSSLELGIDMGAVDLVIQVESPPSVASGLQRVGRAGHNVGDVSRGVIFPKYHGDLVQAAVVAERMHAGAIEELRIPRNPLDVLAQQIVAMAALDDWAVDDLEPTVRRAAPFAALTRPVLEAVLDMLAGRYPARSSPGCGRGWSGTGSPGMIRGRPGAQRLAVTSGGTIPDRGLFGVFLARTASGTAPGRQPRRVGELDEEMVYESRVGDVFVLGASSWRIEDITADRVLVCPRPASRAGCRSGTATRRAARPSSARRSARTCRELAAAGEQRRPRRLLRGDGLDALAAANLLGYLADQRAATGYVPDDRTLVVERFRDELGDWRVVLHSPYGGRVHAPWALAIAARLRERYGGMDVQALHTDDGIVIRVPDADDPPPAGIALLDPEEVEQLVTAELGASALFASRFRECAARALLLPRRQPGRRTPLWQQRQRSAQLLSGQPVPGVPDRAGDGPRVPAGRVRRARPDRADARPRRPADPAGRGGDARRRRRSGARCCSATSARSCTRATRRWPSAAPQALALDPALLADLLGQAELRELLDPAVVAETERDLQHLSPSRPLPRRRGRRRPAAHIWAR